MKDNVKEYEIKLGEEWTNILDKTFKKKNNETKIDGFRKGKAPKDVYLKHFGIQSLYADSIDEAINVAYQKLVKENEIKPVITPSVDVTGLSDANVILKFTVISKPKVTLGDYKNLKVKKDKVEVTEEEINHEIEHLRSHMADIVVKEKGVIAEGDTAVIDFDGYVDGKALDGGKAENYPLEIGSNSFIPGFEEGLIGLKAGEEKELKLKFPENYVADLKGKDVLFKVKVNEVKTKVYPEMDQAFFDDLGYENVKSESDLRNKIKDEIKQDKMHQVDDKFLDACLEAAAKNMEVDINEEIVHEEVHRMIEQYASQLRMQGMNIDDYYKLTNTTEEDLHKQMEPEALKRVKYRFLIETIAEVEKLEFTDEEADKRAEELAQNYGVTKEQLLEDYGGMEIVKYDMKMHKAMEILKEANEK